jgi:hypothetical protein
MMVMRRVSVAATFLGVLAVGTQPGNAQVVAPAAPGVTAPSGAMRWHDLRDAEAPDSLALQRLWKDRLDVSSEKWRAAPGQTSALPAFTLASALRTASGTPVVVSLLFNLYDCELPGNGAGAELFSRCPMRLLIGGGAGGAGGASQVKTIDRACLLYVPPVASPREGPDPRSNFTNVTLDATRTLHLRVVQFGRPVPQCDLDVPLGV